MIAILFPSQELLCDTFWGVCDCGHLKMTHFLWDKAVEQGCQREMLAHNDYVAFYAASHQGRLNVVDFLYAKAIEHGSQKAMLAVDDYRAFRGASLEGHLDVVQFLYAKAVEQEVHGIMLVIDEHYAFRVASEKGHLSVVQFLYDKAVEQDCQRQILAHDDYRAFRLASLEGRFHVVQFLYAQAVEQDVQKEMLVIDEYYAFRIASEKGYLRVVEFLYHKALEQNCHREMLAHNDYTAFRSAASLNRLNVIQFLWQKSVEQHCQKEMLLAQNYEAFICAAQSGSLNLVKFLHAKAVQQGCEAEMLATDNYAAYRAAVLDQRTYVVYFLEKVASSGERRVMYQLKAQLVSTNLRAEAANRESAMMGLKEEQIAQLKDIKNYYQTGMNAAAVIVQFRELLVSKYREKPAEYSGYKLPLTYKELELFIRRNRLISQREQILRCYYRHEVHTAYRYLLLDNPWLHPKALFGVVTENNIRKKTVFEKHQEMIAVMFKAATDPHIVSSEVSTEDRLSFFITSFGDIARAHNRERTGFATTAEVDDMEADKPSCEIGIARRLLNAVIGHPLLLPLSEMIESHITEQMKRYFESKITAGNAQLLLDAWNSCIEFPTEDAISVLKQLDPSQEELDQIVSQVQRNLSVQVAMSPSLTEYAQSSGATVLINNKLSLSAGMACYAICFAQKAQLQTMLESAVAVLDKNAGAYAVLLSNIDVSGAKESLLQTPYLTRYSQ